ncbi:hypothetical protein LTR95_016384, partial [Oleoguttula sp. CCFEE 5521]
MYRSLDHARREIRLLVVQPGREDELLRCSFKYALLASPERPRYETISYVWGDDTNGLAVDLDGALVSVPLSSAKALQCIRHPDRERVVWIDAVCISQVDSEERARQVALMADIYMHGTCNLAVLGGQEEDRGGLAARAIEKIREHALGEFGGLDAFDDMWIFESIEKLEPLSIDITQESVDATILHYDGAQIDLLHVRQVIIYLQLDPYREQGICEQIVDVFTLTNLREMAYLCRCPPEKPIRMDSLLEIASSFDVTDSRDVVYGMLGLFQRARDAEDIPALLSPDYTKDATVVLRDATRFAIEDRLYMGLLWRPQTHMVVQNGDRPILSWVPSLRDAYEHRGWPRSFAWANAAHGASHSIAKLAPHSPGDRDDILSVEGLLLDAVHARTPHTESSPSDR